MESDYKNLRREYADKPNGYYDTERKELLEFIPSNAETVLDIGCGSGNFGRLVKSRINCEYWGIEPNEQAAANAEKKLDVIINKTFSADLPELENKFFDVIFFNDVLEHLVNPENMLVGCRNKLSENGIVFASIPNILFYPAVEYLLIKQDWKYQESGILDKTHLRFYTKKSMIRMFDDCGYEIVSIDGINPCSGFRYKILNLLTLNYIKDWKYLQFVVRAIVKRN